MLRRGDSETTKGALEHKFIRIYFRSEEHTSELQSQSNLVCRLLLEKKNRLRVVRRRLAGAHRVRSAHPRPRARSIPQIAGYEGDAGAHRIHAPDRQSAPKLEVTRA